MAPIKPPYPERGLASFEALDEFQTTDMLLGGHSPALLIGQNLPVEAGDTFEKFEVVGLNEAGFIKPATADKTVQAGFVVTQAITGSADMQTKVPCFHQGNFNPDALVWDESFDTDAKKEMAFFGASAPTQIIVTKRL